MKLGDKVRIFPPFDECYADTYPIALIRFDAKYLELVE